MANFKTINDNKKYIKLQDESKHNKNCLDE